MNKYQNGKIYRLVNDMDIEIYIGCTYVSLTNRMYNHFGDCRRRPNTKLYQYMNKIGKEHFSIILVENYPCNSKVELEKRERYWIDKMNPSLNTIKRSIFTEFDKRDYDRARKQTEHYKAQRIAYDKSERGKAARARHEVKRKWKRTLKRMESIIEKYKQVKPIEIRHFELQ